MLQKGGDPTNRVNGVIFSFLSKNYEVETLLFNMIGERVTGEGFFVSSDMGLDLLIDTGMFVNYMIIKDQVEPFSYSYAFLTIKGFRFTEHPLMLMEEGKFVPFIERKFVELIEDGRTEFSKS